MVEHRRYRSLPLKRRQKRRRFTRLSLVLMGALLGSNLLLTAFRTVSGYWRQPLVMAQRPVGQVVNRAEVASGLRQIQTANGRPILNPLPLAEEVWDCEVVVIGGTLGGVAAAAQAMKTGATTCVIELTPWLGGQISSQGVSAIDESRAMRWRRNFSPSWEAFKDLIQRQPVYLPKWTGLPGQLLVGQINSCWVGELCFTPRAGATASELWLRQAAQRAPQSRWATSTAFKGAAFDASGRNITAVYGVRRIPRDPGYVPTGRLSEELEEWYSWSDSDRYNKIPLRLQPPPGRRMIVIDATDTGELVGWANFPHRIGSDAQAWTGEVNAPPKDNPDCTQAYTYPFVLATLNDRNSSLKELQKIEPAFTKEEHRGEFDLEGFKFFNAGSVFNYRRIVSRKPGADQVNITRPGEMTLINWNKGNDWHFMDPPLVLTEEDLRLSGQKQNWLGGLSTESLRYGEIHALMFAEWLIEKEATAKLPLTFLKGEDAPLGTLSGLSIVPYIREGRRILGRPAYGQDSFMAGEFDIREDMTGGRDFSPTAVALAHYDIDIHGCRYRVWRPTYEAAGASIKEFVVRPLQIPLEAIVPQGVDNVLIGGKSIAVSHIVNGVSRVHYGEWSIGGAAGATAGWLLRYGKPYDLTPAQIVVTGQMPSLQAFLVDQGLRFTW
ncbi:MAG TPA: FAD-dependent oxidoreductase [Leptolyngbyaceae cyanobacterium M65_K2018_010]|nr:FAD-dependent oxidoreductase [Leptolyngbyaceae cyanobacterium M65_K2018_010]